MSSTIPPVGVIGCGLMGSGIAEVLARAGRQVLVHEIDHAAAERGRARIAASLGRAVRTGKLSEQDSEDVLARISVNPDLHALAGADLVI
jgi:3-hydroxybutyryl-CoA dehydrogenase